MGLLGACTVLPACVVAVIGAWSFATNSDGGWLWPPDVVTMSEAVATGDYAEVARQIDRGDDPNRAAGVRAPLLSSRALHLTPLQAAVWGRNPLMVKMLLERGAIVGSTGLAVLKCMNDENGSREVRELLDAVPVEAGPPCSEVSVPR